MSPSLTALNATCANYVRPLALLLSLSLLTAALPVGSLSRTVQPEAQSTTGSSASTSLSTQEATAAAGSRQASTTAEPTQAASIAEAYGKLPLSFEANKGQFDRQAQFMARGSGYGLFLTSTEAVLVLTNTTAGQDKIKDRISGAKSTAALQAKVRKDRLRGVEAEVAGGAKNVRAATPESTVLRMKLEGANPAVQAQGMDELPGKTNYLIGNDPQKWHTDIPSYARVTYREVYPGIDLVYYGKGQQLEYDFVVAPGSDPNIIKLAFEGAQSIDVDAGGDLVLHTAGGEVRQRKPVVYQEVDGTRREIPSRYMLKDQRRVGFQVDAYDASKPLVIDPVLLYSTYLGGSSSDEGFGIAVDAAGHAYVTGRTISFNFPVVNPVQGSRGFASDAFVSKLNRNGSGLIYSTYLGGKSTDVALSIAIDARGSAYVTGYTFSSDFPVVNALQATLGGQDDPFVAKLSPQGSALIYSTYLGGSSYEAGYSIAVDADKNAYLTGFTYSHDFPVVNPFQAKKAGHQAFRSTDGGVNWNASDSGLDGARLNDLAIDPAHPSTLYSASEQGVFKSTDGGGTWAAASRGLQNTGDALRLAVNPSNTSILFVGTTFGLYKSTDGGNTWSPSLIEGSPEINAIAIDPVNTSTIYTSAFGSFFKSTNGGSTWQPKPITDQFGEIPVSAIAINPNNTSIIYAGTFGYGVYKSTDGGDHWSSTPLSFSFITDLVIDPLNPSIIYASTEFDGVFKSTNGGNNWNAINNGLPPFTTIPALAIDPANTSFIYAATNGRGLFKSTDGGAQWSAVNTGLTNRVVTGIAIDPTDKAKVYVVTSSLADAFVTKLNSSGSARLYATYLGGDEHERGRGIALNRSGNAYLTGHTSSLNFPVENPLQASSANPDLVINDAFVTKLDASGSSLDYSTYLGGNGDEVGTAIAVDRPGNAFLTGYAVRYELHVTFPITPGAFQTNFKGSVNAFVTKINAAGSELVYSTFLGGDALGFECCSEQYAYGIALNSFGQAFVTGQTFSPRFPLANPTQGGLNGSTDAFVTRFNAAGSALIFSTYLGGFSTFFNEQANGIAVDSASSAYVVGTTTSNTFPTTPGALQRNRAGGLDAFITKIGAPPASVRISGRVLFDGVGLGGVTLTVRNEAGAVIRTTTTLSNGSYFVDVPGGGTYSITPSKPGYTFSPPSLTLSNLGTDVPDQNFSAIQITYSIRAVAEDMFGGGVSGVKFTLTGTRTRTCTTPSSGFCAFHNLPATGHYTITPSRSGATFNPASRTFNNLDQDEFVRFKVGFTIKGRVTGAGGIGVGGVSVKLTGSRAQTTITDNHGNYAFENVPAGGDYVVTPSKPRVFFVLAYERFFYLSGPRIANFQALININGRVRLAGKSAGVGGVRVQLTGSQAAITTTDADGFYSFSGLLAGGNYTVTPSKPGYSFDPPKRTFNGLDASPLPSSTSFSATQTP